MLNKAPPQSGVLIEVLQAHFSQLVCLFVFCNDLDDVRSCSSLLLYVFSKLLAQQLYQRRHQQLTPKITPTKNPYMDKQCPYLLYSVSEPVRYIISLAAKNKFIFGLMNLNFAHITWPRCDILSWVQLFPMETSPMSQDWLHRTPPIWFHMYFTASSSQASLVRIWSCCITWSNVSKFRGGILTFPIPFGDVSFFTCRYKDQAGTWGSQAFSGYNCCYVTL